MSRRLSPVQAEVLVRTHDRTLGGVNMIRGKKATIRALIRMGLAEPHFTFGWNPSGYDSCKRTAAGDKVRQDLLDAGHVDPGPEY